MAGLNPFRLFDDNYQGFLGLVAGQISASIANAHAYEEGTQRAEALAEIDRAKTTVLLQRQPRVPHAADAHAGAAGGRAGRADEHALRRPARAAGRRASQRAAAAASWSTRCSTSRASRPAACRPVYEPTDLAALTADLASGFRSAVEKAGLRLVVDCPPLAEPVYVDRDMWEKIVLNLLSNAFKFTFEGGIAVVGADATAERRC